MTDENPLMAELYHLASVLPSKPPADTEGPDWYCYTIVQGSNVITGYRQGSLRAVTDAADEIVAQLNERRIGKRSRVHLIMPSTKKPADK